MCFNQTEPSSSQNLLGLVSHFVVFPFFALLLRGRSGWLPAAVVLAGILIEALTTSRATLALAGFGFATLLMLSVVRRVSSRKMLVLLVGAAFTAIIAPLVLSSFDQRKFVNDQAESDYDRDSFLRVAAMILSDHPLGIGSNHYLMIANAEGYEDAAGVLPNSRTSIVHNVYWLVATETGYLGLIAFLILLLHPLTAAFLCGWRTPGDPRGDLLLGLGVALLTVYIHSFYEWIFVRPETQYMFVLEVGLVAGLAQQIGYWRRPYRKLLARPSASMQSRGTRGSATR